MNDLSLGDDDGFEFEGLDNDVPPVSYELCLVRTFLTDRPVNYVIMKNHMASLWRPGRGLTVKDLSPRLFLF